MEVSHVSALHTKHAHLDRQLHEEMSRPVPDIATLQLLKRRKLRIKDEIGHN